MVVRSSSGQLAVTWLRRVVLAYYSGYLQHLSVLALFESTVIVHARKSELSRMQAKVWAKNLGIPVLRAFVFQDVFDFCIVIN
jgi:hypothetical protein